MPFAFTEHGVVMLSSVLRSDKAVEINIKVVKAFIEMRKFLQSNAQVFQRLDSMEIKMIETNIKLSSTDSRIDQVFALMECGEAKFRQGVFFENQIFDAYHVISDLFRTAKKSILIIDNYVDDSVLVHLTEVAKGVKVKILTKSISEKLSLDIKKFSAQYFPIVAEVFTLAHDRYIVIDHEKVYHVGASLKDLGKKWFAFSKIEKSDMEVISRLKDFE
jgi:hypothetical protein